MSESGGTQPAPQQIFSSCGTNCSENFTRQKIRVYLALLSIMFPNLCPKSARASLWSLRWCQGSCERRHRMGPFGSKRYCTPSWRLTMAAPKSTHFVDSFFFSNPLCSGLLLVFLLIWLLRLWNDVYPLEITWCISESMNFRRGSWGSFSGTLCTDWSISFWFCWRCCSIW